MNSLTNEQIARVFAMYIGCRSVGLNGNSFGKVGLGTDDDHISIHALVGSGGKLLLKSLSAISDEDAIKVMDLPDDAVVLKVARDEQCVWVEYKWRDPEPSLNINDGYSYSGASFYFSGPHSAEEFQCLVQLGYSMPLYPWNKTAIELGLAIDSTALE